MANKAIYSTVSGFVAKLVFSLSKVKLSLKAVNNAFS